MRALSRGGLSTRSISSRTGPAPSPGSVNCRDETSGIQPDALVPWIRWSMSGSARLRRWPNAVASRATQKSCETGASGGGQPHVSTKARVTAMLQPFRAATGGKPRSASRS